MLFNIDRQRCLVPWYISKKEGKFALDIEARSFRTATGQKLLRNLFEIHS
jgi:hypothetical protein